jgi:hypothetical protein
MFKYKKIQPLLPSGVENTMEHLHARTDRAPRITRTIAILALAVSLALLVSIFVWPANARVADPGSVISQQKPAEDSPEIIRMLQSHTVYLAESQEARMNGVIRYIGGISHGSGVMELRWIQEDYLATASSIPLMETSAEIKAARQEMQDKSVLFSDETANQMTRSGGDAEAMKACINDATQELDRSSGDSNATHWLQTGGALLILFDRSTGDRNTTLSLLYGQGADVTKASDFSDRILAERPMLKNVVFHKGDATLKSENSRLKLLNQQFRNAIRECRYSLAIRNQVAEINAIKD